WQGKLAHQPEPQSRLRAKRRTRTRSAPDGLAKVVRGHPYLVLSRAVLRLPGDEASRAPRVLVGVTNRDALDHRTQAAEQPPRVDSPGDASNERAIQHAASDRREQYAEGTHRRAGRRQIGQCIQARYAWSARRLCRNALQPFCPSSQRLL